MVHVEDRHAGDRRAGPSGGRVGDVVRADDQGHVGAPELGVDVLHLAQRGVGDVGLGEQHVHVARHAAGHRVDRVLDLDPARLEQLRELAHRVLRLRDRQAVARHDDHARGIRKLDRRIVDTELPDGAALAARRHRAFAAAESAGDDVHDRAVHGVGHELGRGCRRRHRPVRPPRSAPGC